MIEADSPVHRWQRIGVLGGSFDPPHCGHVLLAAYAFMVGALDGVLVVPAFAHPHAKRSAPFEHRLAMTRLAFAALDPSRVAVSALEATLPAPTYTIRTVEALHAALPGRTLRWIIGSDLVESTRTWRDAERVRVLAPFFVVGRGAAGGPEGATSAPLEMPAVSSSEVRARLAGGASAIGLIASDVEDYVRANRLYEDA